MSRMLLDFELESVSGGDTIVVTGRKQPSSDPWATSISAWEARSLFGNQDNPLADDFAGTEFPDAFDPSTSPMTLIQPEESEIDATNDGNLRENQERQLENYYNDQLGGDWNVEFNEETGKFHAWDSEAPPSVA